MKEPMMFTPTTLSCRQMDTTELQSRLNLYRQMYINEQAPSGRTLTEVEIVDARWKVATLENELAGRTQ